MEVYNCKVFILQELMDYNIKDCSGHCGKLKMYTINPRANIKITKQCGQ